MIDFTWGETVRIKASAPPRLQPSAIASVCGIREVETREQEQKFGGRIGTRLYLVEFHDGESIEIPEEWLEPA